METVKKATSPTPSPPESRLKTSDNFTAESRPGDGDAHPTDGQVTPDEDWCFDTDPTKVQFKVDGHDNNNISTDRMTKVKSISRNLMVFTVINNPGDARYRTYVVAHAYVPEYKCE